LLDPKLFAAKLQAESEFKVRLQGDEFAEARTAYDRIAESLRATAPMAKRLMLLEHSFGFVSESFEIARTLLRAAEERPKPDGERLEEFSESAKASLELSLFSTRPIYPDLET